MNEIEEIKTRAITADVVDEISSVIFPKGSDNRSE